MNESIFEFDYYSIIIMSILTSVEHNHKLLVVFEEVSVKANIGRCKRLFETHSIKTLCDIVGTG